MTAYYEEQYVIQILDDSVLKQHNYRNYIHISLSSKTEWGFIIYYVTKNSATHFAKEDAIWIIKNKLNGILCIIEKLQK